MACATCRGETPPFCRPFIQTRLQRQYRIHIVANHAAEFRKSASGNASSGLPPAHSFYHRRRHIVRFAERHAFRDRAIRQPGVDTLLPRPDNVGVSPDTVQH